MPSEQVAAAASAPDSLGRGGAEMSQLAHAVLCGQLPLVAQLLSAPGTDVNAQDDQGRTPLMLACYQGWLDGVLLLLQHGARKDIRDRNGRLPLHAVTYSKNLSTLAAIADGGGKAELNAVDNEVMTAVHWAAFHGRPGILTQLLDYSLVDAFALDIDRKTALHWAAQNNCVACVDILLRHESAGEKLAGAHDVAGKTPLHCAAAGGSADAIRRLAKSKHCDVDSKDNDMRTPLHWAGGLGRAEAASLLLDLDADPLVVDSCGKTPLDYATDAGHTACRAAMENRIRRRTIEIATKRWSQKIRSAAEAARDSAAARRSGTVGGASSRRQLAAATTSGTAVRQLGAMPADLSASTGSVSSTRPLSSGHDDKDESNLSVNLSMLSLKEDGTVKAESDLWSRLGAVDVPKASAATFLGGQQQPSLRAVERRRLAPLRVSHQNLAFLASHGQGLDSPTSSISSLSTLNSLLAPLEKRQASDEDLERGLRLRTTQQILLQDGRLAQTRNTPANGGVEAAGSEDEEAGATAAAASSLSGNGAWPSTDSFAERQDNSPKGARLGDGGDADRVASTATELTYLRVPANSTARIGAGLERADSIPNEAAIDIESSEVAPADKTKKKVSRVKRKIYPSFESAETKLWTDDDPAQVLKYVNEAADSTNL